MNCEKTTSSTISSELKISEAKRTIASDLEMLEQEISTVKNYADILRERLQPVMGKLPEVENDLSEEEDSRFRCELSIAITKQIYDISQIKKTIEFILDRLQI